MATKWSGVAILVGGFTTTGGSPLTIQYANLSNPGALLTAHYAVASAGSAVTSVTIADNMTNTGWNIVAPSILNPAGTSIYDVFAWKVATMADFLAIGLFTNPSVTFTPVGGSSYGDAFLYGDIWFVPWPEWSAGAIDLHGSYAPGTAYSSYSFASAVGSSQPTDADELCWISYMNGTPNFGVDIAFASPPAQFSDGGAPTNIPPFSNIETTTFGPLMESSCAGGGFQASATAGNNLWTGGVTGSPAVNSVLRSATFYYVENAQIVGVT